MRKFEHWVCFPQYHLVFENFFESIFCQGDNDAVDNSISNELFCCNRDWYAKEEANDANDIIYWPPPLDDVWLDEQGGCAHKDELACQRHHHGNILC